jgi:DNA-binding GntR family transcriptional regulator
MSPRSVARLRPGMTVAQVVRSLADGIVHGELAPGTPLDEGSLAARFGVSRTPVREALRELTAMGLVERPPNRRAVVTSTSGQRLREMFEAMAELESAVARLCVERMTTAERRHLLDIHRNSFALVRDGAAERYKEYNVLFHRTLYAGCHSAYMAELVTALKDRLAPFRRAQFDVGDRLQRSWQEHERIVAAILRKEPLEAAEQARAHIENVGMASDRFAGHG